jgi:glucosamine-6-phosphate deaminase
MILKNFKTDNLEVFVHDTRANMGEQVAEHFAEYVKALLAEKDEVNIIFAAAPSQNDFLRSLAKKEGIDYSRINIFHMDEYVGISIDKEQSFARFVKESVVDNFVGAKYYHLNGAAESMEEECARYTALLKKYPVDIVCLGIGENGHIAFNDPWVADFWDSEWVKVVELDDMCRQQQVNDGCFPTFDDVPKFAFTLTIPTMLRAKAMFCTVPAITKANAVKNTLEGPIGEACPATALRIHKNAKLYCDADSASLLS